MNPMLAMLIALRSTSLVLNMAGHQKIADGLLGIADAYEAGRATEEHMKMVADKLKTRSLRLDDWTEVFEAINTDRAELHRPD